MTETPVNTASLEEFEPHRIDFGVELDGAGGHAHVDHLLGHEAADDSRQAQGF